MEHTGINSPQGQKLPVGALLQNPPLLQQQDPVAESRAGQPVGE